MTDTKKITELDELVTVATGDFVPIVDVSDLTGGASGTTKKIQRDNLVGLGDVVGPASAVDDNIATFDLTTGKLIQDGGSTIAEVLARANHTGTQLANTISDFVTQVQANSIDNVSEDTNPILKRQETAGEALVSGDLVYLNASNKYVKADASAESTAKGRLLMANATISSDAVGDFIQLGEFTTSGLTAGDTYYMSETTGAITNVQPTTSTSIVRIVGDAKSTTVLIFAPDRSWVEVL